MPQIDKVQISPNSDFNLEIAMELANLIAVAYNEYEVWDRQPNKKEKLPPDIIKTSTKFVDLPVDALEEVQEPNGYEKLDVSWEKTGNLAIYDRLDNFWFPQWWWGEVLKLETLWELLKTDIRSLFSNFRDLIKDLDIIDDQLFGFIAKSQTQPNKFVVVFRGTREAAEWFNNFRPVPKPFLPTESFGNLGEVRNGFNLIYASDGRKSQHPTIQQTIAKFFKNHQISKDTQIYVTGHSLGAGLATLAALHMHKIAETRGIQPSIQLYTFASPRVGDEIFAEYFDSIDSFRIINSEDLIQAVPLPTTQVIDDDIQANMSPTQKARFLGFKAFLETITVGQSGKCYQHVGVPVTFTKQTGTIAGNHNLTKTYREALHLTNESPEEQD